MKLNGLLDLDRSLPAFDELAEGLREGRAPARRCRSTTPRGRIRGRPGAPARPAAPDHHPAHRSCPPVDRRSSAPGCRMKCPSTTSPTPTPFPMSASPGWPRRCQRRLETLVSLLTWEAAGGEEEQRSRGAEVQGSGGVEDHEIRNTEYAPRSTLHASRITSHAPIAVASARSLMQMTLPVREMHAALRTIRPAQPFDLNRMLRSWVSLGYEAAAVVEAPGHFSRRGGIVDIWPPNLRKPLRIELLRR